MISVKNVILPNKPLNNFELVDAARKLKIPYFKGVFLLDTLPRKRIRKNAVSLISIKAAAPARIGSLGTKTAKLKPTSIVTACNHHWKLLSTWGARYIITPINYKPRGKFFAGICVYTFSKNLAMDIRF